MAGNEVDAPRRQQKGSSSSMERSEQAQRTPTASSHTLSSEHREEKNHHRLRPKSSTDHSPVALARTPKETRSPGVPTPSSHTSSYGIQDKKQQVKMFQTAYAIFALAVFCTLAGWFLYIVMTTPKPEMKKSRFCCPSILRELDEVMNRSKDPCNDFYYYTCYAWRENRSSAIYQRLTEEVVRPIFQLEAVGEKGNPSAGHLSTKIIGRYYRSCMEYAFKGLQHAVTASVLAVIETIKDVQPDSSGATMLGGMLLLSAEYYLFTVVDFIYFPQKGVSSPDLQMFLSVPFYRETISMDDIRMAVLVYNAHYGTNVSAAAVIAFDEEIARRKQDTRRRSLLRSNPALLTSSRWRTDIESLSYSTRVRTVVRRRTSSSNSETQSGVTNADPFEAKNLTLWDLGRAVPTVPQETWKDALLAGGYWYNDTRVYIIDRLAVSYVLGVLINSSSREVAFALVITMAAYSLDLGLWTGLRSGVAMPSKLCENITNDLSPLWDVALTHVLTTPQKDATVRGIYANVLSTVKQAALAILDPSDVPRLNLLWNTFRLLLPSYRNPPHSNVTVNISKTATHSEYSFAILRYWVFYDRFQEANEYPYELSVSRNVYNTTVVMTDNYVFVPPAVYALLHFDSGTDLFVNMAILGIQIADVAWMAFMRHSGWNNVSKRKIKELECDSDRGVHPFKFPWLSLWTAVKTSVGSAWRTSMEGRGLWEVSKSQIFHMMVFYHHVCKSTVNKTTGDSLSRFMEMVPDFNDAFNCSQPNSTIPCLAARQRILSPAGLWL